MSADAAEFHRCAVYRERQTRPRFFGAGELEGQLAEKQRGQRERWTVLGVPRDAARGYVSIVNEGGNIKERPEPKQKPRKLGAAATDLRAWVNVIDGMIRS